MNCSKKSFLDFFICFVVYSSSGQNLLAVNYKLRCGQGRYERGTIARTSNHRGRTSKSSNNVASIFFNTVDLLPKDIRFEHGGVKLASCLGRHLSLLRPYVWWVLQQIISLPYPVTSHWWVSILDRICCMKTWNYIFKVIYPIEAHYITGQTLSLWNNVWVFGN